MRLKKYAWDARTFPHDAALAWRHEGWVGVWAEFRERTVNRAFRRGRFLVIEQDLHVFRETPVPDGVEIGAFTGDWNSLAGIVTRRKRERYRWIAAQGRTCLVAWREGRPIGYTWYSERMDPEIETYPLPLPGDAAYLWDLYVVPSERSGGIGSALVSARLRHARERGFRKGWRMISPRNQPSLRTLEKTAGAGARILGELSHVKLLARSRIRYRPTRTNELTAPPKVH